MVFHACVCFVTCLQIYERREAAISILFFSNLRHIKINSSQSVYFKKNSLPAILFDKYRKDLILGKVRVSPGAGGRSALSPFVIRLRDRVQTAVLKTKGERLDKELNEELHKKSVHCSSSDVSSNPSSIFIFSFFFHRPNELSSYVLKTFLSTALGGWGLLYRFT